MTRRRRRRRKPELEIEWDSSREWPARWVKWLLRRVVEDYKEQRFSIDLDAKLEDRGLVLRNVVETITSRRRYVARFRHQDGVNRVGFWDPRTEVIVVWKPGSHRSPSRFMTCFRVRNGVAYMLKYDEFREICRGEVQ